ncbi:hypothetical protein LO762_27995 [Actinocorallia sp. API 0066]|uniref:hypothetical protein n=1 Tax=Actinocorallia sp. API 0066 TaxID=2896846 RepID=UPI001E298C62|nr:hypothetical protein [Actinocorallia sp. API 0066]MCD0452994.1 hypothetical protein [Actinocorallia sp. API 0066]
MTTPFIERLPRFHHTRLIVKALLPRLKEEEPLTEDTLRELAWVARSVHEQVLDMLKLPPTPEGIDARGAWLDLVDSMLDAFHPRKSNPKVEEILDKHVYGASEAIRAAVQKVGDKFATPEVYRYDPAGDDLEIVIAQADYMSGDTFGVHAALTLHHGAGLAFFYESASADHRKRADVLLRFYNSCPLAGGRRIALIPVHNARLAYRYSLEGYFPPSVFPKGAPKIVSGTGTCVAIGNATRIVAEAFGTSAKNSQAALQAAWLPKGWETGAVSLVPGGKTIAAWVAERFTKQNAYAFLWFRRSGAAGGAHPELDTSVKATTDLIATIREKGLIENAKIVIVGDGGHKLEKVVDVDLTEFWNDKESPFITGDRRMQLALFAYLVKAGYNFMNIGMRSGALEGPALLGARTVYLEEIYNLQEGRMEQWQGPVPGYHRVELGHVPSASGKQALAATLDRSVLDNQKELADAALAVAGILGFGAPPTRGAIFQAANSEPADGTKVFKPRPVAEAFTLLCGKWQQELGVKSIKAALGDSWAEFAWQTKVAIRAAQALHKARVKQRICAAYTGPDEGLSDADKSTLWQAVGGTIDKWEVVGKRGGHKH